MSHAHTNGADGSSRPERSTQMSRTSRNYALAAAALMRLGAIALSSNDASARGFGGGGFHGGGFHGGGFHGGGFRGGLHGGGFRVGMVRRPMLIPRSPHRHSHSHPHWRPRIVIGAPVIAAAAYAAYRAAPAYAAPVANRCTCLTK